MREGGRRKGIAICRGVKDSKINNGRPQPPVLPPSLLRWSHVFPPGKVEFKHSPGMFRQLPFPVSFSPPLPHSLSSRPIRRRRPSFSHLVYHPRLHSSLPSFFPPSFAPSSGPNWKSLCQPAILPLTTDYLPTPEQLRRDYTEGFYTLMLPEGADRQEREREGAWEGGRKE